jgi:glycosyltransferase involved in cell wall biosynthesis
MPQFSIIIPCYNQAEWLKICVQSLQNQTFENWEAIIVNDGSTDKTKETADYLAKNDHRIKVIHQSNGGLSAARNSGMQLAEGEWLNFLDSDDYFDINCLQMVFKTIQLNPSFHIIQTGHHLVDEQNQIISSRIPKIDDGLFLDAISKGNDAPVLSVFVKRDFFEKLGNFDTTLKSAEDWDMWIRAAKNEGKRKIIYQPLVAVRHLQNSMTRNPWRMYENTVSVIKRLPLKDNRIKQNSPLNVDANIDVHKAIKARLIQALGLNIMQGNIEEALDKFNLESKKYEFNYHPIDFRQMNSFMTFKNWYRVEDVKKVLSEYPKFYEDFFSKTNFTTGFQKKACYYVFEFHVKNSNLIKYHFLGKIINRVLDVTVNSKKNREENGVKS